MLLNSVKAATCASSKRLHRQLYQVGLLTAACALILMSQASAHAAWSKICEGVQSSFTSTTVHTTGMDPISTTKMKFGSAPSHSNQIPVGSIVVVVEFSDLSLSYQVPDDDAGNTYSATDIGGTRGEDGAPQCSIWFSHTTHVINSGQYVTVTSQNPLTNLWIGVWNPWSGSIVGGGGQIVRSAAPSGPYNTLSIGNPQ